MHYIQHSCKAEAKVIFVFKHLCFSHPDGKMSNAKPSKSFLCFESQTDRENTLEVEKSFMSSMTLCKMIKQSNIDQNTIYFQSKI